MLNELLLRNVYTKTLRDMLRALLWWSGGLFVLCLWMVTLYPSIAAAPEFSSLLENMPESLRALVGEATSLSTLEGYLSVELFSFFLPALTIAFALSFGGSFISKQEESGALDMLLSNPVPRWRVMLDKFAALVVFTLLVLLACYVGTLAGAAVVDVEIDAVRVLEGFLAMFAITLFFGALALGITGLGGGHGLAVGFAAGVAAVTYFLDTMQPITDLPEWAQRLSPWYYYGGDTVLADGVTWWHLALLLGLTVLFVAVGTLVFERRDLGT